MPKRGPGLLAKVRPAVMGSSVVSGGENEVTKNTEMRTNTQHSGSKEYIGMNRAQSKRLGEREPIEIE